MPEPIPRQFAISLSFPRKHLRLVRKVAQILAITVGRERVFLDEWHFEQFGGNGGADRLRQIYCDQSELIVPFFSSHYKTAFWCGIEWDAMKSILDESKEAAIIPVRMDSTEIDDWKKSDVDISYGARGAENAEKIAERILNVYKHRFSKPILREGEQVPKGPVNQESASQSQPPQKAEAEWRHLFIVSCDICNSSNVGFEIQDAIQMLWETAKDAGVVLPKSGDLANSLLDGMIVAVSRAEGNARQKLVDDCSSWIQIWKSKKPKSGLRIAIHEGDVCCMELHGQSIIVGPAVNECSRLVRFAGPEQIVLSQSFVDGWTKQTGPLNCLSPPLDNPPIEIPIKPGEPSRFRIFSPETTTVAPSIQLLRVDGADKAIEAILKRICREYVELLEIRYPKLGINKIQPRISLFAHRTKEDVLESTDFRVAWERSKMEFVRIKEKGKTKYPISDRQRPIGPIGHAFVEKDVKVANNLPDYRSAPEKYCERLFADWGIPKALVDGFGVKPRSLVGIPVFLHSDSELADAVLCLDTLHPLTKYDHEMLAKLGAYFQQAFGLSLAALWLLRY